MDRLVWAVVPCFVFAGCQAPTPSFDPFALTGQTRIPAPATGAVGRPGNYDPAAPATLPPLNTDGWSEGNSLAPQPQAPSSTVQPPPLSHRVPLDRSEPSNLRPADRLAWRKSHVAGPDEDRPTVQEDPSVVAYPASSVDRETTDSPYAQGPRPLPNPGPNQPLASHSVTDAPPASPPVSSPPRIRGFVNSGVREVRIPTSLAEVPAGGVRQAAGGSDRWQARYGSAR